MALASSFRKPIHNSRFTIHRGVRLLLAVCTCLILLAFGGCNKSSSSKLATQPSASPPAKPIPSMPPLDVCALLTKEEIQAVQGSPITDTKNSEVPGGVFLVGQCYYAAAESSKSVSLAVTRSNPQLNKSVRDYWKETFGRFSDKANEKEEEAEKAKEEAAKGEKRRGEEEEGRPPKKIEGVGEEAFWSGNRFGGALYALKKETIVRVSVGGPDNEDAKINKSKALAEKALNRL
jgi:hypothetical protein